MGKLTKRGMRLIIISVMPALVLILAVVYFSAYTILQQVMENQLSSAVISNVKVSKSGAVEIEFKDSAAARRFAMDYCEYTERIAG